MSPDQWNLICHRRSWPSTSYFFLNFTSCPLPLTFPPRTQINLVTLSANQKQIHKTSPDPWVFSSRPWPTASRKKSSPSCTCTRGPLHTGGFCLPGSPVLLGPHLLDVSTRTPCQHPLPFRIAFSPCSSGPCPPPSHVSPPPATSVREVLCSVHCPETNILQNVCNKVVLRPICYISHNSHVL